MLEEPLSEEETERRAIVKLLKERADDNGPGTSIEELIDEYNLHGYIQEHGGKSPWIDHPENKPNA